MPGGKFLMSLNISQEKLKGILPPPSITTMRIDVTEMLKKYYCFLPAFNNEVKVTNPESDPVTPTKRVSFIEIPEGPLVPSEEIAMPSKVKAEVDTDLLNTSANDKSIVLPMCTEADVKEAQWPDILKCRHYDV